MKLKKLIFSFAMIIFMLEILAGIICNATEDKSQMVILNDFSEIEKNIEPIKEENKDVLKIYSEAAILIEAKTGKILYDKDIYSRKNPASTTKILTAIIAIEECDLNEKAIASHNAVHSVKSGYTVADIQEGESFTIKELLDVLMLQSANEAANILAEHISGSIEEFTKLMNQKAKEIGCLDSNFVNANGAHSDNHYSTAYDLAMIAKYCMQNETFRELVKKEVCSLQATEFFDKERIFRNTNSLMQPNSRYYYPYCNGIKTGYTTPAKNCLISSSNKNGFELISVILHAESTDEGLSARYEDTINLFEYGYDNFNKDTIWEEYNFTEIAENENLNANININEVVTDGFVGEKTEKQEVFETEEITEISTGAIKKEYNSPEKNTEFIGWIQLITGITILIVAGRMYLIKYLNNVENLKKIRKIQDKEIIKKDDLYNFKLS